MPEKSDAALKEEEILKFWTDNKIFDKSLKKDAPKGEFVFYDGPPFATGLPHAGSLLSSVSKDLFPRYKTMQGFSVRRRWGWDTHGLPIESLVEKKLGLKNKKEILAIGIKKFNEEARSMVLEYVHDWKRYVERVGRWVDFDNSYKTMDASYTESVWWALKEIHKKGNLYEGRKVLMYCPHCETVLAKAEIAMDNTYKDITEEAVYVKFKIKDRNEYLVAWTTTPWTLPANTALAVNPDIEYVYVQSDDETLIFAKDRALALGLQFGDRVVKGSALHGLRYEPLFSIKKAEAHTGSKFQVFAANFVTAEDGTGIVHTGTIYGEDDYELIKKEGLPALQLLNANGTYNDDAPEFVRGQYIKKAGVPIMEDIERRGLLFRREAHTHSYPHCYRCDTPLIYNAVSSWFINIQRVKSKLLSENEKIGWHPEHLKHGRFQKNLESAPDWTISRNRFWASPLPIWKDADGNVTVIGSVEELKRYTKKSGNTYYVVRHGEAENNVAETLNGDPKNVFPLTQKGRDQARAAGESLKGKGVTRIIASNMTRTQETAAIIAEVLGLPTTAIQTDVRFKEVNFGNLEGKSVHDLLADIPTNNVWLRRAVNGGEALPDIRKRVGEAIYEIERTYTNETVLIVSHDKPMRMLFDAAHLRHEGYFDGAAMASDFFLQNAEVRPLPFVPLPHNDGYELDYHLPYIDEVVLEKDGKKLTRIPEVVDCWVESGAMPFAEYHYPFENKELFEKRSPGDFVSEYIGQTRAWFYYMHAMSVQLFDRQPFRHVMTTGTVNASDGQKLSKSKKNYTDPYALFDTYGADAFRFYLMSSVVMLAEDLQFRDEDVKEAHARVVNMLRNITSFYSLYAADAPGASDKSTHTLDRWILARLSELVQTVTTSLDSYDTVHATRPIRDFIDDFSTWYVRRSRDRVKGDDESDKAHALATLRHVLITLSKVMAPITPFVADEVYRTVRASTDPESVHLTAWPQVGGGLVDTVRSWFGKDTLLDDMSEVRRVVTLALEARQKANIKVRQPLQKLVVGSKLLTGKVGLLALIKDEINVKEVIVDAIEGVQLDTNITDELREEGEVRDLVREVQELRKGAGLAPQDRAVLTVPADRAEFVTKHWDTLAKAAGLSTHIVGDTLSVRVQ